MGHVSSKEGIPVFPFKSPLFFGMVKAHLGWRLFGWHSCAQPPSHRDTQPAEYHPSRILRGLLVEGWEERMGFWKWETHRGSMQSVGVSVFFLQFFDANRFWWLGGYPKITQGLPVVSKNPKSEDAYLIFTLNQLLNLLFQKTLLSVWWGQSHLALF